MRRYVVPFGVHDGGGLVKRALSVVLLDPAGRLNSLSSD